MTGLPDYLRDRIQIVEDPYVMEAGVPQGFISGPLLYIRHFNDLPGVVVDCSLLMNADDTMLFFSAEQAFLIEELAKREQWLRGNS